MAIRYGSANTMLGTLLLARSERGICFLAPVDLPGEPPVLERLRAIAGDEAIIEDQAAVAPWLSRVRAWIEEGRAADDLPLDLRGTEFRRRVWEALRAIPPGSTLTYAELARQLGSPRAARAVGSSCGANPVPLLVPCHRVVATGGGLGGFGWGLEVKRALLDRERERLAGRRAQTSRESAAVGATRTAVP